MQNLSLKFILSAATCLAMSAALAEPNTTSQLMEITERTAVLEARIKELELQNRVDKALAERVQRDGRSSGTSPSLDASIGTPVVSYVEGRKDRLEAMLVYPNGARQRVRVGDALYGTVVQKIELNEVLLLDVKAKTTVRLQFAAATPQSTSNNQNVPIPQQFSGPVPPVVIPSLPR